MKISPLAFSALLLVTLQDPLPHTSAGEAKEPKHLADAKLLLKDLLPQNSSYRHKDADVQWKGGGAKAEPEANVCHTDCSGFLDALLTHSYGYKEADFKKWFDSKRPTARRYYEQISRENGFKKIALLKDLQPGDIVAVKYPEGDKNTGHVMLAASAAKLVKSSKPRVEGTDQWEVTVIDCSMSGHGASDTRRLEDGKSRNGLGRGVLRLYTDKAGALAGYAWSTFGNSTYQDQDHHPINIGRIVADFKPK